MKDNFCPFLTRCKYFRGNGSPRKCVFYHKEENKCLHKNGERWFEKKQKKVVERRLKEIRRFLENKNKKVEEEEANRIPHKTVIIEEIIKILNIDETDEGKFSMQMQRVSTDMLWLLFRKIKNQENKENQGN